MEQPGQDAALKRAEQLYQEARQYLTQKRLNEALAMLQKALILQPGRAAFHSLQGEAYWMLGKADLATAKFKRALLLDPDDAVACRYLASPPAAGLASPPLNSVGTATPSPSTRITEEPPAAEDLVLTSSGEEAVLEGAHQVLTRLVQMEMMMKAAGDLGTQMFQQLSTLRRSLSHKIQEAFRARSGDKAAAESPAAAGVTQPPASTPARPPEWQAMPPFQKVIGGTGGINQGPEVLNLQKILRHEGLSLQLTGVYDRYTAMAIRQFQEKRGIKPANGIVGSETRRALNAIMGKDLTS